MEIWKDIKLIPRFTYNGGEIYNYLDFTGQGYQVSSKGRLRNANGKILSDNKIKYGFIVNNLLNTEGKMKTVQRHLLVISTFKFDTYKSGTQVFHLDGNKLNNEVNNLVFFYKYKK